MKTPGILLALLMLVAPAAELEPVELPTPQKTGGKPLMQALELRQSRRRFKPDPLPVQTLSNLLWAAWGVNRPETGKRTAPSAVDWQEIDIYVALETGTFRYNAAEHRLDPVSGVDIRASCGRQEFTGIAPVDLVYVADFSKMQCAPDLQEFYSACGTGFISQNVYLFCASEGLATVVIGLVDRSGLVPLLGLKATQHVTLVQPVGYPK